MKQKKKERSHLNQVTKMYAVRDKNYVKVYNYNHKSGSLKFTLRAEYIDPMEKLELKDLTRKVMR